MGSAAPINSVDYSTGWVAQSSSVLPVPLQHVFEPSGNQNPYNGPGGPLHTAFMTSSSPGTDSFDFTTQPSRDTTAAVSSIGAVWPGLRPGPRALMPTCPSTNSNAAIGIPPPNGSTSLESHSVLETPSPNHVPARVVISQAPLPYSPPNPPAFGTRSHLQDTKRSSIDTPHTRLINCPIVPHDESPPKEAPQFEMPLSNAEDILRVLPASHSDGSAEYIRHCPSPHPSPPPSRRPIPLQNDPQDDRPAKKRRASPSYQGLRPTSLAGNQTIASSPIKEVTPAHLDSHAQLQTSAVGKKHTNDGCFKCRERAKVGV
ncbi:hypothetical protein DL93DRAFT_2173466 [Clavulina sp. PMI_390]|nr:hypothetical protein DL93DRAFT_2173466 [Clavulina sp. PMI_390]